MVFRLPTPSLNRKRGASRRGPGLLRQGLKIAPWLAAAAVALWPARVYGVGGLREAWFRAREPGRGRLARSPAQIPARGWGDILWRTWKAFNEDHIPTVAGGMTFFLLLALFPGLAAFVALYGLFADVHGVQQQVAALASIAPRPAVVFLGEQMILISVQRPSTLSLAFATSLLVSIWSANAGMKALFHGLNVAYEERERRGYLRLTLVSLVFTFGGLAFLLAWMAVVVAAPLVLPFLDASRGWVDVLRWPALLALSVMVLAVVYRFGPSRQHARWRWVTWGGAAAATLWLASSFLYSWYVANFAHYDRTFGSLGAAVGGLIWMWMSAMIVLLGAEFNAQIEHQTTVDSTTGPAVPMGRRGARMADTVGEALNG